MTMQSHPVTPDDLNAYVDGTLAADQRQRVEAAIAADEDLSLELRELQAVSRLLGELPELAPRRSFALGQEFARPTPLHAPTPLAVPGKIVRLLPIVRSLSVAAVLVFMVVAGALFFDINGNTTDTTVGDQGVTESQGGASEDAEDAPDAAAPETDDDESSMTSRGDAASVGDEPMDDLTALEDGEDEDSSGEVAQSVDTTSSAATAESSDGERASWKWTSAALGVLAVALAGLWFVLAQVGRQSHARRS